MNDLTEEVLALQNPEAVSILKILMHASVAWITKTEDRRLKRFRRSANPLDDYANAGICLLPEQN